MKKSDRTPPSIRFGVLDLPALLCRQSLEKFVVVGGVARSGTTFVGNVLHAQQDAFCFEEFMPFKNPQQIATLEIIRAGLVAERKLWTDEVGRNWRGLLAEEDHQRLLYQIFALMAGGTSKRALQGKDANAIRIIACKTPTSELTFQRISALLAPLPCLYVHCVREPWSMAQSIWEMPWVQSLDGAAFLKDLANHMAESLKSYNAIVDSGLPMHLVKAESLWNEQTSGLHRQRLLAAAGSRAEATGDLHQADHWPRDRRRNVATLNQSLRDWFYGRPGVKAWRRAFGYA